MISRPWRGGRKARKGEASKRVAMAPLETGAEAAVEVAQV